MKLDYGTQLSPLPITLSIGSLRKPKLIDISELSFDKFSFYQFVLKMDPETYFTELKKEEGGQDYWNALRDDEKYNMSIYDVIVTDIGICQLYLEILNYFFIEPVIYKEGLFIILKEKIDEENKVNADNIKGVIAKETFSQVLEIIQQICYVYQEEENIDNVKFKNSLAKKLFEKMLKAKKEENERKKANINMMLPNIISSVSNRHPSINPINVWNLTLFQLLDTFNRMQINEIYEIDSTRVSVWGDEKKTFDASLWYKNEYDQN